jgi:hypothetical protein
VGKYIDATVEVFAKAALADLLAQVLIRGGDDAHIHLHRSGVTQGLELILLEDAQQFGLNGGADFRAADDCVRRLFPVVIRGRRVQRVW